MTGVPDGMTALAASFMMAVSPVTGPCDGRVVMLCDGSGTVHRTIVWDDEGTFPEPQAGSKACHACLTDKRKTRPGEVDGDSDEI